MKICLISSVYPPRIGGPSTQTRHFATLIKEQGITPIVITFGKRDGIGLDEGVKVYYLNSHEEPLVGPFLQYSNAFLRLWKILRNEKPDIIQHQTGVDFLSVISGFLAKRLGIPSVIKYAGDLVWERLGANHSNNFSYEEIFNSSLQGRFLTRIERFALNNFTYIWATSQFQKDSLTRILKINNNKIRSYPNYIMLDTNTLSKTAKDKLTILSVCRFAYWKRIDNTLRAFAKLNKNNTVLKIVGGGNPVLENELKKLAVDLGIQDNVEFIGSVSPSRVNDLFNAADIFVSSTTHEPFGITFVEAMNAGLPIVATKVGGIPDVVPEEKAGFLVQPNHIDEMADRIRLLADDFRLRREFGEYGRQWAKKFDLKEHISTFLDLYKQMGDPNIIRQRPSSDKRISPVVEGLDKKRLYDYYKDQQEDFSRMYKDKYRKNKQRRRLDIIKELLSGYNNMDNFILDIGCGDGYASSYLLNGYLLKTYFGLDLSAQKLKIVLNRIKCSSAIIGDAENLPVSDASVHTVLCLETLEHLLNPIATLKEIERILKPGGISLISIPIDSALQKILVKGMRKLSKKRNSHFNEHIHLFTMRSINPFLDGTSFKVLTKLFCGFNFPLLDLIATRLPYGVFSSIDNLLCKLPLQCFGIGTKFGLSFGREYLILAVQKP